MKTYTIIGGVNGAGKSSLTGTIKTERTDLGRIIDVDKLAQREKLDNINAGKRAIAIINECLENGISFTQETTLSGIRTLNTIKQARDKGYVIRLYYVGLDTADESLKRIENRVKKGGHNIGTADVIRRFSNRFDVLAKVLPYCDEVIFYDNDNGFVKVAEYKNGEIIPLGVTPNWMNELILVL